MRETRVMTDGLRAAIERSGYYPGLVSDAVASALGSEPVTAYVVHHDAIFDPGMEVRRHMTVLALTPTRLVYSHTDEHPAEDPDIRPRAETSTEAIRFAPDLLRGPHPGRPDPAAYAPGVTMPSEVMLTIGWNVLSHLELEPAYCGATRAARQTTATSARSPPMTSRCGSARPRTGTRPCAGCWVSPERSPTPPRCLHACSAPAAFFLPLPPAQWHDVPARRAVAPTSSR